MPPENLKVIFEPRSALHHSDFQSKSILLPLILIILFPLKNRQFEDYEDLESMRTDSKSLVIGYRLRSSQSSQF